MRFVSIPTNGSSWQEPLVYNFETDDAQPADVLVEIRDIGSNSVLATKHLYAVVSGEVDIAPYLRSVCDLRVELNAESSVRDAQISRNISVRLNGEESEPRLFVPRGLDVAKPSILSRFATDGSILLGDVLAFSLFTPSKVNVIVNIITQAKRKQLYLQWAGSGRIIDVAIQTKEFDADTQRIEVNVYSDNVAIKTLSFKVIDPDARRRQLLWRNTWGALESYIFPQSIPLAQTVSAETLRLNSRDVVTLADAHIYSRLCSAFESQKEIVRISEILLSPYIYEVVEGELREVELDSRKIEYDEHGNLRRLALDIVEEWKGGGL